MEYNNGIIKNTEFFTTSELAEKLKMNVQVITRKVQAGEIFAYKIGKDWRIPESSVFQWLENNSNRKNSQSAKRQVAKGAGKQTHPPEPLPTQAGKRKYLLEYILAQFEANRGYSEDEVNRIISRQHANYNSVREEFIAEQMMEKVGDRYQRRVEYQFSD
jgi:excisionase family DNA binding protein